MVKIESLFFTVVNRGKANAVLHKAQECGATGGTIFLGEGTIQSKLLEKIGLTQVNKEVIIISASEDLCDKLHETLSEAFAFSKRNNGIAFSIPFKRWQLQSPEQNQTSSQNITSPATFCIITIVDKGRSVDCIKSARAAGARGGTLIHGRGAGIPTNFYFPLVIEPQKDIVMIVTTKDKVVQISEKIYSDLELEKTGNGIIFTLPVTKTSGLFEYRTEKREEVTT